MSGQIFTIDATNPFAAVLADYCEKLAVEHDVALSEIKLFLPTRRGIRTLQQAFLQLSQGKPRLLPVLQSIGDADLEEASFAAPDGDTIPPSIDPLQRQMVLARLLEAAWPHDYHYHQALAVAADLSQLIDQIHTQNLDIETLPSCLEQSELSQYWQITTDFLIMVLGRLWPDYLREQGMIDPGLHRRLRIEALTSHYRNHPPAAPVIMAGSTGSIPAVRDFIKTLHSHPNGIIILPSLDTMMDDKAWINVGGGHPQFLLKQLLDYCNIRRADVQPLGSASGNRDRLFLASEIMRPAETAEIWQSLHDPLEGQRIINGLQGLRYCEADSDHHESMIISLAMLEIAADPAQKKTVTLITPDRHLAMRVQANLSRWGIDVDDSGGTSLTNTPLGQFALSTLQSFVNGHIAPPPLLTALKSPYAGGGKLYQGQGFRQDVRALELDVFRGVRPHGDFKSIAEQYPQQKDFLNNLHDIFSPLLPYQSGRHPVSSMITAHLTVMESLAATPYQAGTDRLWIGDAGEAMSLFFASLRHYAPVALPLTLTDYAQMLQSFLSRQSYTARYGKHPRLSILGQIEARMVQETRVILAGLNEGIWPPQGGFDVWMSRAMRSRFGLPSLEQKTTLAAHDFSAGFCAPDVLVTRSKKSGGQPTLPSRWIGRMETVLQAANIPQDKWPHHQGAIYAHWAHKVQQIPQGITLPECKRPAPTPSLDHRPTEFSVTEIVKWMRDPYWIYAKKILRLKKLDDVDMDVTAADRGTLIHKTLEEFTKSYPGKILPHNALDILLDIGKINFDREAKNPEIHGFWWPRFTNAARWFINHDRIWRSGTSVIYSEIKGSLPLTIRNVPFILTGKADRIDRRDDGSYALIDYKTGSAPKAEDVIAGIDAQLPLEAYMLTHNAFAEIAAPEAQNFVLLYWSMSGAKDGGSKRTAQGTRFKGDTAQLVTEAAQGLHNLLTAFYDPSVPYIASPDPDRSIRTEHNDYAHLERTAEWSVTDDSEDSEAA